MSRVREWAAAVRRNPLTVGCLFALVLVSFVQRPGRVTFDTKLDLAVNPTGFMERSLHLWNPMATSGELQNQAYGYLFPMGPFFAVGQALGVPMWVTQRLWGALLLCLAFGGVLLVARALRIGTPTTRHFAALVYALAPRMLTEIGPVSAEMLPAALLPWVLLPLIHVRTPRRSAALSGLAVLCIGGVNAAIVVMVLVLPGLWLVTRPFTRRNLAVLGWWVVAVTLSVLWWLLPLFLLGRYSLPFLSFVESSANTTGVVSLFQAVRGTNQWVAYVVEGEPWWPAGFLLVDSPVLMAATAVVATVGLVGLSARGLPERRFLVLSLLAGVTMLTVGFVGSLDSPFSDFARDLLDGPLAPLRNVHKIEPVLRLPVALGLAHALTLVPAFLRTRAVTVPRIRRIPSWRILPALTVPGPAVATAATAVLIVVVAAPAWLFALRPGPGWSDLPGYWRQAAGWLESQDKDARTLMVPGTGFGVYTWGRTVDEPIQPLAGAPWALRSQVPLGSAGNTRFLDTVEQVLAGGQGSPGLSAYLARNGYRFVLLRNDIDRSRPDTPPIAVLRQALQRSDGLTLATAFGPNRSPADWQRSPVDDGELPPQAIEIYEVRHDVPLARAVPMDEVAAVSGGPESMLPLLEQGALTYDRPAVLAGDLPPETRRWQGPFLVTDGLRSRERNVGLVRDNLSHTLTATEQARQDRPTLDILPVAGTEHLTTAEYQGVRAVNASTAESFADSVVGINPSRLPFSAIDGDIATAWHSASAAGPQGQWLEVTLDTPRRITRVGLRWVEDVRVGWRVTRFRITTDRGSVDHDVRLGYDITYPAPDGLTTTVRITVLDVVGGNTTGDVGISELSLPGIAMRRALRVPSDQGTATGAPTYAFTRGPEVRPACYESPDINPGTVRCDVNLARSGEEPQGIDRLFRTPRNARYGLSLTAVPKAGGPAPLLPGSVIVGASSWLAGDTRVTPLAAVDGDPTTAWLADLGDGAPTLRLQWQGQRTLDRITVRFPGRPVGSRPHGIELRTPAGTRIAFLRADGSATFPAVTTDRVDIVVTGYEPRLVDRRGGARAEATVGFAEVDLPAIADLRKPVPADTRFEVPCGYGPSVELDGVRLPTSVSGTLADYHDRTPLPVRICDLFAADQLDLAAGEHHLRVNPSESFLGQDATLQPTGADAVGQGSGATAKVAPTARATTVERWESTERRVRVAAGPAALLVIPENANEGWRATLDGRPLTATRVDGWQQAWEVPEGAGGAVVLTFTPDATYRSGLALGAGAALFVVVLAVVPPLRRRPDRASGPTGPGRSAAILFSLAVLALVTAIAGVLGVVLLLAGALLRQLYPRALGWVVVGGAGAATVVAVAGRLSGHGQDWAYGWVAQAAMLVAVCSGVAAAAVTVPGTPDPDGPRLAPGLDDQAEQDEQPGDGRGGGGDGGDRPVEPPRDEADLQGDREPDREDRPHVAAGDAGEQQQLGNGKQRPREGEQPQDDGFPAVSGTTDDR
jgi:arabinofuranan 3-O-arabinosyltransferase